MAIIIDLEDCESSPSPSPRSSKKRSYDGTLIGDRGVSHESTPEKLLNDAITNTSTAEDPAESSVVEGELSEDNSEADELREEEIKNLLQTALDTIDDHSTGSFATTAVLPNAANPGLYIQGLGGIGLPLSEHDACRLAVSSHQVSIEQGNEPFADTSGVRMWDYDRAQLETRNPAWQQTLNEALVKVATDLGIPAGPTDIRAELCRLSLYGEGTSGELCRDPKKTPNVFGTLLILLPSSHKGGAVETCFGEERRMLESALTSDFNISYLAWYADVEYGLHKITSGYRLFLTYNLIHQGEGIPQCAASLVRDKQKVTDALKEWQTFRRRETHYWPLAFMLEHNYADSNLRIHDLKSKDQTKALILQKACQEQGFAFFIANMEQTVSGMCEEAYHRYQSHYYDTSEDDTAEEDDEHHSIVDETDRIVKLRTVALPSGSVYAREVYFKAENILQPEGFEEDPDEEDYDAGNVTHYYRSSCILITPEDSQDEFFFESALGSLSETKYLLDYLLKSLQVIESKTSEPVLHPSPQPCHFRLERFCRYILTGNHYSYDKVLYEDVVSAVLRLDQPSLFLMIAKSSADNISLSAYRKIGLALSFQVSQPLEWQIGTGIAIRKSKSVYETWVALSEVAEGVKASLKNASTPGKISLDSIYAWMYSTIAATFESPSLLDSKDAETLVKIALGHEHGDQFMIRTILPYIKRNAADKRTTFAFLRTVYDSYKDTRKNVAENLYRDMMSDFGPELCKLNEPVTPLKRPNYSELYASGSTPEPDGYGHGSSAPFQSNRSEPSEIAGLLGQCLSLGLKNEVQSILQEMLQRSGYYPVATFDSMWIPFLQNFLMVLTTSFDQTSRDYGYFFQTIIDNYIRRYLGVTPFTPGMTTPILRGCGCSECQYLNSFLLNPKQQTGRFRYKKPIRDHLISQIGRSYKHTTETLGKPHTLVITKDGAEYKAKRAVTEYQERCKQARRSLVSIGIPDLNKLLGTSGDDLTNFQSARNKLIAAGSTRGPLANIAQPVSVLTPRERLSLAEAGKASMTDAFRCANGSPPQANPTNITRRPDYISEMTKLCEPRNLRPNFGTSSRGNDNGPGHHHYGILSLIDMNGGVSQIVHPPPNEHFTTEMALRQALAQRACIWLKEKQSDS